MIRRHLLIGSGLALGVAATVVMASAAPQAAAPTPSFDADIQPIFDGYCVGCHQEGSAQAGLSLEAGRAYAAIVGTPSTEVQTMLRVSPGGPDKSYLLAKLESTHLARGGTGDAMPLGDRLDPAAVSKIRAWITAGAPSH